MAADIDLSNPGDSATVLNGAAGDKAGTSIAAVNINGTSGVIVGAPAANSGYGAAYVVLDSPGAGTSLNLADADIHLLGSSAERAGASVAAGDFNGDDFEDLIVGAQYADSGNGTIYLIFGDSNGFPQTINLADVGSSGIPGIKVNGGNAGDLSQQSVAVGDMNGDQVDDLIIGAPYAEYSSSSGAGMTYVLFGSSELLSSSATIDLATVGTAGGAAGIRLIGAAARDQAGGSVAAGDLNGDGIDDVIIGAPNAHHGATSSVYGAVYVVYGRTESFQSPIGLANVGAGGGNPAGLALYGVDINDHLGRSVAAVNINADKSSTEHAIDDLVVGADFVGTNAQSAGATYVVFGDTNGISSAIDLGNLDGTNGFVLNGAAMDDRSGYSVAPAGDVNDDGIDDLVIGAPYVDNATTTNHDYGASYVIFGSTNQFSPSINLGSLDEITGFTVNGAAAEDRSGSSVAAAGDIDGDGSGDVLIGAPGASGGAGAAYVAYGTASTTNFNDHLNRLIDETNAIDAPFWFKRLLVRELQAVGRAAAKGHGRVARLIVTVFIDTVDYLSPRWVDAGDAAELILLGNQLRTGI